MNTFVDDTKLMSQAKDEAYSIPLEDFDVSHWDLHAANRHWPYFERLRKESPVYFHQDSRAAGPFWSVTKFRDIKYVDTNHELFSSHVNILLHDMKEDLTLPSFLNLDPPQHDVQRQVVAPIVSPGNLGNMEPVIRERVCNILNDLPTGVEIDWVKRVSIELTTQMLATLFNVPFDHRYRLTRWSEVSAAGPGEITRQQRQKELGECLEYFLRLRDERLKNPGEFDLVTMLAHGESTKDLEPMKFLANIILLIVGGNDTTRNSITGGVVALNKFPEEFEKLRKDPGLIPNMVPEIIRWQTPLAYMRRTATQDCQVGGKDIKKGDKVVMWYVSGNRDEDAFKHPDRLIIDRENPREHVAFGYGLHRCMGNRLAEMQLRVLWEEIMKRFDDIEVVGKPVRSVSNFIRGYTLLPVIVHAKK